MDLYFLRLRNIPYVYTTRLQCRRPQFNSWLRKIPLRIDSLPALVFLGFPGGSDSKESICNAGYLGAIFGLGRSPGEEHGKPLQYSCLENPQGQRSLASYSPWGCKELDTTEWLSTAQQSIIIAASEIMLIETWKYSREVDQINVRPVSHQL